MNRLAGEKSPYLLQHRHNPVDWFPWGEEAFARARSENRPIFLSIGYSTCHWCHVMERESFESADVAAFLNAYFVSIKVDREERPDVDRVYMAYVQATAGSGGWPLNVFLTPERKPFYGGTYFPPASRYGQPAFSKVLQTVAAAWHDRQGELVSLADDTQRKLAEQMAMHREDPATAPLTHDLLHQAAAALQSGYDPVHGGWGDAPKFPTPSLPAFLLRYGVAHDSAPAVAMVLQNCEQMAAGGIYDHLGGGFSRYAVDAAWVVPHFEKMLYDNAQLARLYLDAFRVSGDPRHADTARGILDYVLRDMTHPAGGFYSAEDADSEGHEGKFYCWTRRELQERLTPAEFTLAVRRFGITEDGNFRDHSHPQPLPGQNVLHLADSALSESERRLLPEICAKLLAARSGRVRPHCDDKILASWNGLMIGACARGYAVLRSDRYRSAAERALVFLREQLWEPATGTLWHRWRDGDHDQAQLLTAYAFLLDGTLELYAATLMPDVLRFACTLADALLFRFYDRVRGGFWQSADAGAELIFQLKDDYDGAEPSGNSVATLALLQLAAITGRGEYRQPAETTLRFYARRLSEAPLGMTAMLQAVLLALREPSRVVIAGDPVAPGFQELLAAVHGVVQPDRVVLGNRGPVDPFAATLPAADGPTAYLCTGTACQPPTRDPAVLAALLIVPRGTAGT